MFNCALLFYIYQCVWWRVTFKVRMPWYNQWSDSIKKRACRYLLQRYLGQFLEEKLTLDQLTVDLYKGTGSVSGVVLDVQVSTL